MKIKELQEILASCDPDATVLIAGFETTASAFVAEADTVVKCNSTYSEEGDHFSGDREVTLTGDNSVWIGWSDDYRTESFLRELPEPWHALTQK
ncbi:hypothetical protein [Buttiauxella gaviniae]|jgi:hypothetical protein|uniref:hypothetical protein n=1 Tax=Buttiauxella gaviniae TaxID=82990 RepID=UPI003C7272B7